MPAWPKVRKFLNDIHLWLGLSSAIIVLLICLSGTIYVFNTEIREWASPEMYRVNPTSGSQRLSAERLIQSVNRQTGGQVTSIKIPSNLYRSYVITVWKTEKADEKLAVKDAGLAERPEQNSKSLSKSSAGAQGIKVPPAPDRSTNYLVDPYTGKVLGSSADKNKVIEFMSLIFSLHRWLLLDRIESPLIGELPNRKLGSYISGTATILFTLGVLTGIIIWFPRKIKSWRNGFTIKWSGNWKRINHDLHNSLGLYSCLFLLMMGITGPQWSFPWYRESLRKLLGTYQHENAPVPESPKSKLPASGGNSNPLILSEYIQSADKVLSYAGDYTIKFPANSSDAILLSKTKNGFFASPASDKVYLDQYTASVLKIEVFNSKPFNERVSNSIKAIHVGDVYGRFTKILYFLACLIATSLPVTGTLIWINKLKKTPTKPVPKFENSEHSI